MKLPVLRAVGATFAFLASHAVALLQIIWLPTVAMYAAMMAVLPSYTQKMTEISVLGPETPPEEMSAKFIAVLPSIGLMMLIAVVANLIIFAGVTKLLVRGERPKLPFYFAFGADELRLLAAWLVNFLVFAGLGIAAALGLGLSRLISASGPGPAGFMINLIVIFGACIAGVMLSLKLSLAAPATIDRRKIGVVDSWNATEDNTGAVFGFWLLLGLIVLVVQIVVGIFTTPPGYTEATRDLMMTGSPEAAERLRTIGMSMYNFSDVGNTIRLIVSFVVSTIAFVVLAVAGGVAWRYLTGAEGGEAVEEAAAA